MTAAQPGTHASRPTPGGTIPCPRPRPTKEPHLKIHPYADMFPLLAEDEMHDLAEAIKTHGLLEPIVLGPDGVLLDGRNRLAACERAGVTPTFTTYTGTDQVAYILSANVHRRHISAGQRAMVQAMYLSLSGHSLRTHAKLHAISRTRLSLANTVLKTAPDLADRVRDGKLPLDTAADIARERKAKADAEQAAYDSLRRYAPDLAVRVTEGDLALDAATHELGRRQDAVHRDQERLAAIAERWDTLQTLANKPDSLHTHQVLDGLTTDHRALITRLTICEARCGEVDQAA
ncbi:ParB/RepB/Spo0J family partition protein [Kitasatospora sp. NPDC002551]|uniref:ParB/RepB/Spo0J family partition protein n=1 Tax=Kitasatospora sp. NPDC002551 TaxID=3154539 RepID=UPI00332E59D2